MPAFSTRFHPFRLFRFDFYRIATAVCNFNCSSFSTTHPQTKYLSSDGLRILWGYRREKINPSGLDGGWNPLDKEIISNWNLHLRNTPAAVVPTPKSTIGNTWNVGLELYETFIFLFPFPNYLNLILQRMKRITLWKN